MSATDNPLALLQQQAQQAQQQPAQPQPDPTQQLEQQGQQSQQNLGQALQQGQQSPQDPLSQVLQQKVQEYTQNLPRPAQGGRIKQLLQSFVGGAGNAMMHEVGLPTPEQQQQQRLTDINQLSQTQSMEQLRQSTEAHNAQMLQNYARTPVSADQAVMAGVAPGTMMTPSELVQAMVGRSKVVGAALTPEQAQAIGHPELSGQSLPSGVSSILGKQATVAGKTPTEIALQMRRDNGDQQAGRVLDRMQQEKIAQMNARGQAMGSYRPVPVLDQNGQLQYQFAGQAIANQATPAAQGVPAMSKQAQFTEMKQASGKFRDAITNLDRDFTPDQIAKLQLAQRAPDEGVVRNITDSLLGDQNLTPAQQDYVIWHNQMMERILSLRNVAGMGQGASDLRGAIQATIPGPKSGSKQFSLKKMDAVDNQINVLSKGIPKTNTSGPADLGPAPEGAVEGRTGKLQGTPFIVQNGRMVKR